MKLMNMGFDEALKKYLENASQEELNKKWDELKDYCNYGSIMLNDDRIELLMDSIITYDIIDSDSYTLTSYIPAA